MLDVGGAMLDLGVGMLAGGIRCWAGAEIANARIATSAAIAIAWRAIRRAARAHGLRDGRNGRRCVGLSAFEEIRLASLP